VGDPYLRIHIELGGLDPAAAEEACFAAGALSVTLSDSADDPVLEPAPGETPLWPTTRLSALFAPGSSGPTLSAALSIALDLSEGAVSHDLLDDRPWEREWLSDFHPMQFGQRLWVRPGGQAIDASGAVVLELDPGLAFGTGTHPTTALCLEWLDGFPLAGISVLDFGCGSGILALAALALGAGHALAVDIDPQALLATAQNAERNQLTDRLEAGLPEVVRGRCVDLVLANILAGPLVELADSLSEAVKPGGRIVLSGLLEDQASGVARAYAAHFEMKPPVAREGWVLLEGVRRGGSATI
jgi:ribosomal protein L11 methyltransferase